MPTIEFTTFNTTTLEDFRPVLAKKLTPEWWKKTKVNVDVRGHKVQTIRSCPAMDDWLKSGWLLTANRDIHVDLENGSDTTFKTRAHNGYGSPSHPNVQTANAFEYLGDSGPVKDAFKMKNPWNIITPKGYSCFYLDPFLFQNEYFATWQGIIDTDNFNKNIDNAQIIFYPKVTHSFTITKGTPLCQVIPFKRETWNASYIVQDSQTFTENRSKVTSHHDNEFPTMDEMSRHKGLSEEERRVTGKMGAYRKEGYWHEKGKNFKQDNPPPECPMHVVSEDTPEIQLELPIGDNNGS